MSTTAIQPISGVSADTENVSMIVYPSMAATGLGRALGNLYESIPLKINGIKLSHLLFPLPTSPGALKIYFYMKIFGNRYVLTNRSVQIWKALGNQMVSEVPLADVAEITLHQSSGQVFFKASDLSLLGADGKLLLQLDGIPNAEVFRETLLKARDARRQVQASLETIAARESA
jgi:hypothetical protein